MTSTTYTSVAAHSQLDDLEQGHSVIIAARWLLVAAGLMFVLYRPQSTTELTVGVLAVLGIAGAFLATWIGQAIGWYRPDQGAGFIGATVGAVVVLFIWHRFVSARAIPDAGAGPR